MHKMFRQRMELRGYWTKLKAFLKVTSANLAEATWRVRKCTFTAEDTLVMLRRRPRSRTFSSVFYRHVMSFVLTVRSWWSKSRTVFGACALCYLRHGAETQKRFVRCCISRRFSLMAFYVTFDFVVQLIHSVRSVFVLLSGMFRIPGALTLDGTAIDCGVVSADLHIALKLLLKVLFSHFKCRRCLSSGRWWRTWL